MSKAIEKSKPQKQAATGGMHPRAGDGGRFLGVTIVDPAVKPTGTSVTAIRKAMRSAEKPASKS